MVRKQTLPKQVERDCISLAFSNQWTKCMWGYVLNMDDYTVRIYKKKQKKS